MIDNNYNIYKNFVNSINISYCAYNGNNSSVNK